MNLIPDIQGKYEDLFLQFLSEPGVLDKLKGIVLEIKSSCQQHAKSPRTIKESLQELPPRSPRPSSHVRRQKKRLIARSPLVLDFSTSRQSEVVECSEKPEEAAEHSKSIGPVLTEHSQSIVPMLTEHSQSIRPVLAEHSQSIRLMLTEHSQCIGLVLTEHSQKSLSEPNEHSLKPKSKGTEPPENSSLSGESEPASHCLKSSGSESKEFSINLEDKSAQLVLGKDSLQSEDLKSDGHSFKLVEPGQDVLSHWSQESASPDNTPRLVEAEPHEHSLQMPIPGAQEQSLQISECLPSQDSIQKLESTPAEYSVKSAGQESQTKALLDDIHAVLVNLRNASDHSEITAESDGDVAASVEDKLDMFSFSEKSTDAVEQTHDHAMQTYVFKNTSSQESKEDKPVDGKSDVENTLEDIEASLSCLSLMDDELSRLNNSPRESTPLPNQASSRIYLIDDVSPSLSSTNGPGPDDNEMKHQKAAHSRTLAKLITRRPKSRTSQESLQKDRPVHVQCNSDCDHTMEGSLQIAPFYQPIIPVSVLPTSFVIKIQEFFNRISGTLTLDFAGDLCEDLGYPYFLRTSLFSAFNKDLNGSFSCTEFLACYQAKAAYLTDLEPVEVIFNIISNFAKERLIRPKHLINIILDLIRCHPSLEFFRQGSGDQMEQFFSTTVMTSIFYSGDGWARKCLSLQQFKNTKFLEKFNEVHEKDEISSVDHFSYDQFYVLYRKFLDLDLNRDDMLDKKELMNYGDNMLLTQRVINRIFAVNLSASPNGLMSYEDFVVFIKADVEKKSPSSIHYWFNVLDVDNDGYVGLQDLRTFYSDSLLLCISMDNLDIDYQIIPLEDIITQLLDSTCPNHHLHYKSWSSVPSSARAHDRIENPKFGQKDLQKSPAFPHLLDAFVNIYRFIINDETSDVIARSSLSAWNLFLEKSMLEMDADD